MKICSKCKVPKSESEFSPQGPKFSGLLKSRCKPCRVEDFKKKHAENPELINARRRERHAENPELRNVSQNKRYSENSEIINARAREKHAENPELKNARKREKYSEDPRYRIEACMRSRVIHAVNDTGGRKSAATKELIGCPWVWLEVHLESLFKPGMTWENYGPVWHVDHIKPCAKFDLTDPEQQRICFHWTNLQPLFAVENIRKGAKYE